jgi:hypothetical protein
LDWVGDSFSLCFDNDPGMGCSVLYRVPLRIALW